MKDEEVVLITSSATAMEDVFNLILQLRQEKLLVSREKEQIQQLNEEISKKIKEVVQSAWITTMQRLLLCQRETALLNSQKINCLLKSNFVEAKSVLGFQNSVKITSILQLLRNQPQLLAKWLKNASDQCEETFQYSSLLQGIVCGLYGCCVFPDDTKYMLLLLYELAKLELLKCDNPRRIIKQRTCSFKNLYFLFHEVLQPAKSFLNAAFQMPLLQLMSYTDYYLDMDPEKTLMRYKNFDEFSNTFKTISNYRNEVVTKLASFTNSFIVSILENIYSFPKALAWIVHHTAKLIEKPFGAKEANAIVTELIFTLFICPVILDPEQYGICNSQVTEITRHNLIQVGQILQSLALSKYEIIDPKMRDLFDLLDKDSFESFFDLLFVDLGDMQPPVDIVPGLARGVSLFTETEIYILINFLQKYQVDGADVGNAIKDSLDGIVSLEEHLSSLNISQSRDNSPKTSRPGSGDSTDSCGNGAKKSNFFLLANKNQKLQENGTKSPNNVVLVFQLHIENDPIGLISEEKYIKQFNSNRNGDFPPVVVSSKMDAIPEPIPNNHINSIKQYSNFVDEGSIGNTSDNLEAISEAASNHSVASSLELENEDQNDNLSDMVSANVSGRGSPNISGRDTPSSQVIENDERAIAENRNQDQDATQPISRQIRSEIDDKFCKFEIKKLMEGDETISIISETWSTDVLASDNETVDAEGRRGERDQRPILPLVDQVVHEGNILDLSETQSESAWSTDVMASDTERTEVDNDDTGSVAQSDDTNSVARSETDENLPSNLRRLSSISSYAPNSSSYSTSSQGSFEEFRKADKNGILDNNANNLIKPVVNDNNPGHSVISTHLTHYEQASSSTTISTTEKTTNYNKNVTTTTMTTIINSRLKEELPGPSGVLKKQRNGPEFVKDYPKDFKRINANSNKKLEERPSEILLSNCSLNSNSSGSSSSNSFENKNSTNENWENKQWLNSSGSSLNVTLTPSESTSELSVLSVTNNGNNAAASMLHKKSATLRSLKSSISTGAIPKSISFDMTADKGLDDDRKGGSGRGSFFGKFRMNFRNRRGKSFRNQDDFGVDGCEDGSKKGLDSPIKINHNSEASDDILAKYRTKPYLESSPIKVNCDVLLKSQKERTLSDNTELNSFIDIKKKLRLVLSNTSEIPHHIKTNRLSIKNKIETILRIELGKARKMKASSNVARISEAIRCVNLLNDKSCLKLVDSMNQDLLLRFNYVKYLINSKQELLLSDMYLDSVKEQISNEKDEYENYLTTVCVREFLNQHEKLINDFCAEYKQLNLADEKCDFLQGFYNNLMSIMNNSHIWHGIFKNKEKYIIIILERFIMSRVYYNSLYPNGDGDRDRDSILHEHIEKLSKIITVDHKDLMIHRIYQREYPWLPAQDALRGLNATRTPRDKVNCVVHCAKCIMDLLAMSQNNGSTTADDFTPVLVFVIIKVNPHALLSTIQFVNSFLHQHLFGEEEYWWTQFCSAVEYIKTMDYSD